MLDPQDFRLIDIARTIDPKIDLTWMLRLGVAGIEVTQATQHFQSHQHLSNSSDYGPDNSIQVIANKPAWVRVYPFSIVGATGIRGTLELQRQDWSGRYRSVRTFWPASNQPVTVPSSFFSDYAAIRGSMDSTLNFSIPAHYMFGRLRFVARISNDSFDAERELEVNATLRQTLRLAAVMISYDGPESGATDADNVTIAAPDIAELPNAARTALTLFPVQSQGNYRTAGTLELRNVLIDPGPFPTSGCGDSWDSLFADVVAVRVADGNQPDWVYYGFLPTGVPIGQVGGCGGGGTAVGPIAAATTTAHEIGHAVGLPHAPSGGAPNADMNYPAYEPYAAADAPNGLIGEYGVDGNTGGIVRPDEQFDLMGYSRPRWISPYHYAKMVNHPRFVPEILPDRDLLLRDWFFERFVEFPWPPIPTIVHDPDRRDIIVSPPHLPPHDYISVLIQIRHGKVEEVRQLVRLNMHAQFDNTAPTPFTVTLNSAGRVLAEASALRLEASAHGCGCDGDKVPDTYLAIALVPNVGQGDGIVINQDGEPVWRR